MLRRLVVLGLALVCASAAFAETPRYVSIRSDAANMRHGPGFDYPLLWQYRRRGLPLEVLDAYRDWRRVRDHSGVEGWMHKRVLRTRRTVIIRDETQATDALHALRTAPDGGIVAFVQVGSIAALEDCTRHWCAIAVGGHRGWMARARLWGVHASEFSD